MKSLVTPFLALLASGTLFSLFEPAGTTRPQEPQEAGDSGGEASDADELDDPLMPPLQRFRRQQKLRIEQEIEGNWILIDSKDPNNPLADEYIDGWASFHDGYMTMFLQIRRLERAVFKDRERRYFQYGAHRYRVSEDLYLQTAAIMASTNINEDRKILYEDSGLPREFQIDIRDDTMQLTNRELVTLEFNRVDDTKFPVEAIQGLQQSR